MLFPRTKVEPYWRTLLILGRTSNLPTVWSNCLAGWLLAGGGPTGPFLLLCLGSTFLYLGGMFLNDAFDVGWDRQYRKERPIPSGAIPADHVWRWGFGLLGGGAVPLILMGTTTGVLAVVLVLCVLVYDALHKVMGFSPILMAVCRCLLVAMAASVGTNGVTGLAVWSSLALGCYIIGLSYLAQRESNRGALQYWPCYLLLAPILLALIANAGPHQTRAILLSLVVAVWLVRSLRFVFADSDANIARAVSSLLAGIVLVDLLAVGGGSPWATVAFAFLFVSALLFQRFVPAT